MADLSEADLRSGIVERFRDVVAAQPDALAVADGADQLSYLQLAAQAAAILGEIRQATVGLARSSAPYGPAQFGALAPVATLAGHNATSIAALLAVIASGHPVLVCDPHNPLPRLRQLLAAVGAQVVIADSAHEQLARGLTQRAIVAGVGPTEVPAELLWARPPDPRGVAAVAFTSGSTGAPRAVANDHRLLIRDAWNSSIATACYGSEDTLAHTLPIAFHAGLTTSVHGLLVGAPMRLYDTRGRGIAGLPAFIAKTGCTVLVSSPAILRALCAANPDPDLLSGLRSVTIAGEAAYARDVAAIRPLLPSHCVVRNRYGSTETGLVAEFIVPPGGWAADGAMPVGRSVGWTRLDVVDEHGQSCSTDQVGRLIVTAPAVALGYWGLPERTAESFWTNPDGTSSFRTNDLGRRGADGLISLVGRSDDSVKVRGYLVDPGEIDAVLFSLPTVAEGVVVGLADPQEGRNRLVAYVSSTEEQPNEQQLRTELRARLPLHMVPDSIVFLARLPRSERGKIDRAALPPPPGRRGQIAPVGGLSDWEVLVAAQWSAVLGLEVIRPEDDFFALGGDSLAAEALLALVCHELGVEERVAHTGLLAQAPTLREFAQALRSAATTHDRALIPLHSAGEKTPLFFIAGGGGLGIAFMSLARRLDGTRPVYAVQWPALEGRGLPERSVTSIAKRYLRVVRQRQPEGPYLLAGHSFGGLIASEMAQQLRQSGQDVAGLIILDSFPPNPAMHPPLPRRSPLGRAKAALGLWHTCLLSGVDGKQHWRCYDHAGAMGLRYRGQPWDGRALVVVADSPDRRKREAWGPFLTGAWTRVDVAGGHVTMLRPPWVDEVAAHLQHFLDQGERAPQIGVLR